MTRRTPGRCLGKALVVVVLIASSLHGERQVQLDTVAVARDSPDSPGSLNKAVSEATAAGRLSQTVFRLCLNSRYLLVKAIEVPVGERLTIEAPQPGPTQDTAPPQILWAEKELSWTDGCLLRVFGDLSMKNVWVYFADTAGVQVGSPIVFSGVGQPPSPQPAQHGIFDNCIFDFMPCPTNGSGVICVAGTHFCGVFRNCYFRNCADPHFTYYGRALSFPHGESGYHIDHLLFENCTFANLGYVYQQENGNYADNVHVNHCSFVNLVMFSLQSGWWHKLSVTNSLWLNAFMRGEEPALYWSYGGPWGGTISIDSVSSFGFAVSFTEEDRRILFAHNSYFLEPWLTDWMENSPSAQEKRRQGLEDYIPRPQPMLNARTAAFFASSAFPYMNAANLYEGINPRMIQPPTDTSAIKEYLEQKWGGCGDKTWAWRPELSAGYIWPLQENLAYTNDTLLNAGMSAFPLGDLYRWFPDDYDRCKTQAEK